MTQHPLLKPGAYGEEGTPGCPDRPALKGGQCACGTVYFPVQIYGCEVCGAHGDALQPRALSGSGTLVASATVYINMGPKTPAVPEVPYVVGEIALDDGPVIRAILTDAAEAGLRPGQRMITRFVEVGNDADGHFRDLRFAPA